MLTESNKEELAIWQKMIQRNKNRGVPCGRLFKRRLDIAELLILL